MDLDNPALLRWMYETVLREAEAGFTVTQIDDSVFTQLYGLNPEQVADVRTAFATWPR